MYIGWHMLNPQNNMIFMWFVQMNACLIFVLFFFLLEFPVFSRWWIISVSFKQALIIIPVIVLTLFHYKSSCCNCSYRLQEPQLSAYLDWIWWHLLFFWCINTHCTFNSHLSIYFPLFILGQPNKLQVLHIYRAGLPAAL